MVEDLKRRKGQAQIGMGQGNLMRWAGLYARMALGFSFLSAVADRFGLWGANGKEGVAWGDFQHFIQYAGMVNSFLPNRVIPAVAWAATICETAFGVGLVLGIYKRYVAIGSAVLLSLFALAMSVSFGPKAPFDYSVFSASAAALLLFATQSRANQSEKSASHGGTDSIEGQTEVMR
jgi:uncharacterized membrane protein YphA (DoxX/SURF4 family)